METILRRRRSLAVVAGMKKPNDHAEPTKAERLKKKKSYIRPAHLYILQFFYTVYTKCVYP